MTLQHIFYIPTIFLFGFIFGTLVNRKDNRTKTSIQDSSQKNLNQTKTSKKQLIITFLLFLIVFIATHAFEIPWSSKAIKHMVGTCDIFDKRPVFSSVEVYKRLSQFSAEAINVYKRFTYTIDILFPLSFFAFLFSYARFVVQRMKITKLTATILVCLPIAWFIFDMIENTSVYTILSYFPTPIEWLAGSLGIITIIKFSLLILSIFTPSIFYILKIKSNNNQ